MLYRVRAIGAPLNINPYVVSSYDASGNHPPQLILFSFLKISRAIDYLQTRQASLAETRVL